MLCPEFLIRYGQKMLSVRGREGKKQREMYSMKAFPKIIDI
jgi:hypothetical protein